MPTQPTDRSLFRRILKWTAIVVAVLVLLGFGLYLWFFRTAIYHRYVEFPREAASWKALEDTRLAVGLEDGWGEYRGILHTHSKFSHDSEMQFSDILEAAKIADINFLFMTDHCVDGQADFSWQWNGLHDGILFVPGFEMQEGFLVWDMPMDTVMSCHMPNPEFFAKQIVDQGGTLFYAHSEEDRHWDIPFYTGMEIYNIHTDFIDEGRGKLPIPMSLLADMLFNHEKYPQQTMRLFFDRHPDIHANWDRLNKERKIVGMSANDAHQNIGIQIFGTEGGNLHIRDTGPDKGKGADINLNPVTRLLARLFLGKIEAGKLLYRYDFDPYAQSVRAVNSHLLANELTQPALVEALRAGRLFVAFDLLADARGFAYIADADGERVTMGEEMVLTPAVKLLAEAPQPCRFTLIHDGEIISTAEGRSFSFAPELPGKYRIEAEILTYTGWKPWIYSNPITLTRS